MISHKMHPFLASHEPVFGGAVIQVGANDPVAIRLYYVSIFREFNQIRFFEYFATKQKEQASIAPKIDEIIIINTNLHFYRFQL